MAYSSNYPQIPSSSRLPPQIEPTPSGQQRSSESTAAHIPFAPSSKRSHKRKNVVNLAPPQPATLNSPFSTSYNDFFTKRATSSAPFSQNLRPSHPISTLIAERKEQFKAPNFIFDFGSTSTPLRRSQSSNISENTPSISSMPLSPLLLERSSASQAPVENTSLSAATFNLLDPAPPVTDPSTSFDLVEMMHLLDAAEAGTPQNTAPTVNLPAYARSLITHFVTPVTYITHSLLVLYSHLDTCRSS
ncbi:hypothetical protein FB451DRAFT_1177576 [Mycena latifolia]|nr:hypothetical protein FB451DRAFT_1177576 [Mycena latifolia]